MPVAEGYVTLIVIKYTVAKPQRTQFAQVSSPEVVRIHIADIYKQITILRINTITV